MRYDEAFYRSLQKNKIEKIRMVTIYQRSFLVDDWIAEADKNIGDA